MTTKSIAVYKFNYRDVTKLERNIIDGPQWITECILKMCHEPVVPDKSRCRTHWESWIREDRLFRRLVIHHQHMENFEVVFFGGECVRVDVFE